MTRRAPALLVLIAIVTVGLRSASAFVVTDPATTARHAVTAVLKNRIVETLQAQLARVRRMADRLSALTDRTRYALPDPPPWRTNGADEVLLTQAYGQALMFGDADGTAYLAVSRPLVPATEALSQVSPAVRHALMTQLATVTLADATVIAGTHQTGQLRSNGDTWERAAIGALEAHVLNPSPDQSATAVLDTISGAALIETRQQQARIQVLTALVEQLLVENKRARDTEAAVLNMQLGRLRGRDDEGGDAWLAGAATDLRTWRQP